MKAPAFLLYVRDWMCSRKIATMTGDQVKGYLYLLCESWLQEPRATLPTDETELAEMARMTPDQWRENRAKIIACFKKSTFENFGQKFYSERLLEVSNASNIKALNRKNKTKTKQKQKHIKPVTALEDEDEDEKALKNNRNKQKTIPAWRTDFEVYRAEAEPHFDAHCEDVEWIATKKEFHPRIDIRKSIQKMWFEYWGTPKGWNKKKASKSAVLDWPTTIENGLNLQCNQVRIPYGQDDEEAKWIDAERIRRAVKQRAAAREPVVGEHPAN